MQAVVHARERKLGVVRERIRENVPNSEVDGFLVEIMLENDEASIERCGLGENRVEGSIGRGTVRSAAGNTPIYGKELAKAKSLRQYYLHTRGIEFVLANTRERKLDRFQTLVNECSYPVQITGVKFIAIAIARTRSSISP